MFAPLKLYSIPIKNVVRVMASGNIAFFINENGDVAVVDMRQGRISKFKGAKGIDLVAKRVLNETIIITRAGSIEFADESALFAPASEWGYFDFGVVHHEKGTVEVDEFEDIVIGKEYIAVLANGKWHFLPLDENVPQMIVKSELNTPLGIAKFIPGDEGYAVVEFGNGQKGALLKLTPYGWVRIGTARPPPNKGIWFVDSGRLFILVDEGFLRSKWAIIDMRGLGNAQGLGR